MPSEIFIFFDECKQHGLNNNIDIKSLGLGKRPQEAWWVVKHEGKIISISGAHKLSFLGQDAWRVLVRSATLPLYRGKAGPFSKSLSHEFTWGHILKHQIEYCKSLGGNKFYFTTNTHNPTLLANEKTNKLVERILVPQGYIEFVSEVNLYDTPQNIWLIKKFPF